MTERSEMLGNLPLQYFDGPDYCTVKDATGGDFALTVQPELMKLMESALSAQAEPGYAVKPLEWGSKRITGEIGIMAQDAYTSIGHYIASDNGWFLQGQSGWSQSACADAAKAAAQADYEQRIRSAIAAMPAPTGEEVTMEELAHELERLHGDINLTHFDEARALLSTYTITKRSAT